MPGHEVRRPHSIQCYFHDLSKQFASIELSKCANISNSHHKIVHNSESSFQNDSVPSTPARHVCPPPYSLKKIYSTDNK